MKDEVGAAGSRPPFGVRRLDAAFLLTKDYADQTD